MNRFEERALAGVVVSYKDVETVANVERERAEDSVVLDADPFEQGGSVAQVY
jgi:hypothetical protein